MQFLQGKIVFGKTDFIAKGGNEIVAVKNVPAWICDNCNESYFTPEVSGKIDKTMKKFHNGKFYAHPIAAGELEFDSDL